MGAVGFARSPPHESQRGSDRGGGRAPTRGCGALRGAPGAGDCRGRHRVHGAPQREARGRERARAPRGGAAGRGARAERAVPWRCGPHQSARCRARTAARGRSSGRLPRACTPRGVGSGAGSRGTAGWHRAAAHSGGGVESMTRRCARVWLCTVLMVAGSPVWLACGRAESEAENGPERAREAAPGVSSFSAEALALAGVEIAAVVHSEFDPDVEGYGRVLDPTAAVEAIGNRDAARAAREAATREAERLAALAKDDQNASARDAEAARAAAARASADHAAADARLVALLGAGALTGRELESLAHQIASRKAALVRIDVSAGDDRPRPERGAQLRTYPESSGALETRYLGPAPDVDPALPGWSYLFAVTGNPPAPGTAIRARLRTLEAPLSGVVVPSTALIHHAEATFVFVERMPRAFERRAVHVRALPDGAWFVFEGLADGERIAVTGAQEIHSAEVLAATGGEK